jgi:hypothetical protein
VLCLGIFNGCHELYHIYLAVGRDYFLVYYPSIILGYFKWFAQQVSFAGGLPQIGIFSSGTVELNPHPPYLPLAGGPIDGI